MSGFSDEQVEAAARVNAGTYTMPSVVALVAERDRAVALLREAAQHLRNIPAMSEQKDRAMWEKIEAFLASLDGPDEPAKPDPRCEACDNDGPVVKWSAVKESGRPYWLAQAEACLSVLLEAGAQEDEALRCAACMNIEAQARSGAMPPFRSTLRHTCPVFHPEPDDDAPSASGSPDTKEDEA